MVFGKQQHHRHHAPQDPGQLPGGRQLAAHPGDGRVRVRGRVPRAAHGHGERVPLGAHGRRPGGGARHGQGQLRALHEVRLGGAQEAHCVHAGGAAAEAADHALGQLLRFHRQRPSADVAHRPQGGLGAAERPQRGRPHRVAPAGAARLPALRPGRDAAPARRAARHDRTPAGRLQGCLPPTAAVDATIF
ncbi:hypothetical protein FOCC_FOCC000869, partial [Frankliniella occidentalis]